MKELVFEKLDERAILPTRSHRTDAGFDLYVSTRYSVYVLNPGSVARFNTGVKVALIPEMWGLILGRSSTLVHHGLMVAPGVVDPGYTGELMIAVQNVTTEPVDVCHGQRLAQFILMGNLNLGCEPVWGQVPEYVNRGSNGFGSTGV